MSDACIHTFASMGTVVTIHVVGHGAEPNIARAADWFPRVEEGCSRFAADSELSQLSARIGEPVPASELLYEAVQFALAVAEASQGAFDPTVGQRMESLGFDREYRTGQIIRTPGAAAPAVSYRDVQLDPECRTITLLRPLVLDLGAVAKGLAVDLAARELQPLPNFAIDAGGDLYLAGCNADGKPWSVGIRHPRDPEQLIDTLRVSNTAVCTSGDYEQRSSNAQEHHIIDARTGASASSVASVTVIAPTAMVADALSTAAFVLGPAAGLEFLEQQGVDGLIVTPNLERFSTRGLRAHA